MKILLSLLVIISSATSVFAQSSQGKLVQGSSSDYGIGALQGNFITQTSAIGSMLIDFAALLGLFLIGHGLVKLKNSADQGSQVKPVDGIWRLIAGSGLLSLTFIASVSMSTVTGSSLSGQKIGDLSLPSDQNLSRSSVNSIMGVNATIISGN